jgi:minor histocompatibility antigen H13
MVTVATQLDVPIKLVFPGPKHGGMLGLGDIVLPGIMMALALRFDIYLHYLRKQSTATKSKLTYTTATGLWGERFWTRSLTTTLLPSNVAGAVFPKVYFYASMIGYVLGMLTTLAVLSIFHHAQPALLYLVPGVLGSLWGTALVRGEMKLMWNYTEAGEADEVEEGKTDGKDLAVADGGKTIAVDHKSKSGEGIESDAKNKLAEMETEAKAEKEKMNEHAHHVFLFSLSSPRKRSKVIP